MKERKGNDIQIKSKWTKNTFKLVVIEVEIDAFRKMANRKWAIDLNRPNRPKLDLDWNDIGT